MNRDRVRVRGSRFEFEFEVEVEFEVEFEIGDIVNSIPVSELAGIEVYPGPASVPGEFAGLRTDCGVVLLWTRVSDRGRPRER